MEQTLLEKFCGENKGKVVTFFLTNGFLLYGKLLDSDATHIALETREYGDSFNGMPKTILLSHSVISTYVPGRTAR